MDMNQRYMRRGRGREEAQQASSTLTSLIDLLVRRYNAIECFGVFQQVIINQKLLMEVAVQHSSKPLLYDFIR